MKEHKIKNLPTLKQNFPNGRSHGIWMKLTGLLRRWNRIASQHGMLFLAKIEKQDTFRRHIISKSNDYRKIQTLKNNQISCETGRFWLSCFKAREGMTRNQSANQWTSDLDVRDKWLKKGSSLCRIEVDHFSHTFVWYVFS